MSPGFTTTILSARWKPRSGKDQVNKHQLDFTKKAQLERVRWSFSGINDGVLLTEYLPHGITINGPCYASIIERLRSVILEKVRDKVSHGVLLLHDNTPIHKCNFVQTAIQQAGFIELNHCAYSSDIASSGSHLFSNLKKFLRLKNFSSDAEAETIVEDYLTDFNSEFFCKGIQSLHDRWQRMIPA